jgi:hypothetical protein
MADRTLRFEIWLDPATHSHELSAVTAHGDNLRRLISPGAVLLHTFDAASDFQAFQQNHDWHGYGAWNPPADQRERYFTEAEVVAQQAYLASRPPG